MDSLIAGEAEAEAPRRGPSLLFAIAVIGGVAALTAGAVAAFFGATAQSAVEVTASAVDVAAVPTQAAADATPDIAADAPILTASLDPVFPPVHKVVTKSYPALKGDALVLKSSPQPKAAAAATKPAAPVTSTAAQAPAGAAKPVQLADAAETDALEPQDPRWARNAGDDLGTNFLSVIPSAAGDIPAADQSGAADDSADDTQTAAIDPGQVKPKRAKAPKADDQSDDATADDSSAPGVSGSTRPAQVNRGVTMRTRGHKGAGVITTIPRGAVVEVAGCKAWCEITYKGRHGYIYKDFLGSGGGSQRTASAKPKDTTPAKPKSVYVVDSQDKPQSNGQDNGQDQQKRVQFTSPRLQ